MPEIQSESIEERIAKLAGGMGADIRDVMQPKAPVMNPPEQKQVTLEMPREIVDTLKSVQQQAGQGLNENRVLAELMADPDILAVIKARRAGQHIQVVQAAPQGLQPPAELPADENDPRKIAEYTTKRLLVDLEKVLEGKLAPYGQQIQQIMGVLQSEGKQRAEKEVADLASSVDDFEEMRPKMQQLLREVGGQGLSLKEAYAIAKLRSGMPLTRETATDTERPTMPLAPNGTPIRRNFAPGPLGMRQMLDEALSKRRPGTNNE